jgi:TetR/AcrR family transcriptional regulator, transcriptional repressor of bet genes
MTSVLPASAQDLSLSGQALDAKHDHRRDQLAESALATIGELGYAKASLREIAANSPFSHGVVHYYFANKSELIAYCVRFFKARCVRRYDEIIETSQTAPELMERFIDKMGESLSDDAAMHRVWYDLRSAAMFEPELRGAVVEINGWLEDMVTRILDRFCELAGARPAHDLATTYAILDGLFEASLIDYTLGDPVAAVNRLKASAAGVLPTLVTA